jgi:hypothetical protein
MTPIDEIKLDSRVRYELLPAHIQPAVKCYIEKGRIPGHFLRAVIANRLSESFAYADVINRGRLHDIVRFFYNEAPGECWGSVEKMEAWASRYGDH